jgi:hypothetical protein
MELQELRDILQLSPLYTEEDLEQAVKRLIEAVTGIELKIVEDNIKEKVGEVYQG